MQKYFKISLYFFAILFACAVVVLIYNTITNTDAPASEHTALALTPSTPEEQKELIAAQEQSETTPINGPLTPFMNATDAQANVLNAK